ncbi:UDP-N-acetyl-D-mannosamine dehydrogenase [Paracoccaceae bacterium]|nr:UDP-N-acetyl-D-mannosamine dehydrogenase [Paracoccaceae bacterium]
MVSEAKSVVVMGLGYIGLPTAALLASKGYRVTGVDVDNKVVETVNAGKVHIVEPGLNSLVHTVTSGGKLVANLEPVPADIFIITVPTPVTEDNNKPDLSYVMKATDTIIPVLKKGNLVILESTSPIGTMIKVMERVKRKKKELYSRHYDGIEPINFAYCPERVLPGKIIHELIENDRVIGGISEKCSQAAQKFYKTFVKGRCIISTSSKTAELTKLVENSYRDLNIAFANQLSLICEENDLNVWELIELANLHPRVNILEPGPGVGGHCIAIDPWFLIHSSPKNSSLIKEARITNLNKTSWLKDFIMAKAKLKPEKKIFCFGLTFKPDVDDTRESPSFEIFSFLSEKLKKRVFAFDPYLESNLALNINVIPLKEAIMGDEIMVMLVDHEQFKSFSPISKDIIDTKGIWKQTL